MLTDTAIRNAKLREKPYKVSDSQGLYLLVNPRGSKLWRVKYRINGVERILVFSDAGGTGRSYHADLAARNQARRVHFLLESGW